MGKTLKKAKKMMNFVKFNGFTKKEHLEMAFRLRDIEKELFEIQNKIALGYGLSGKIMRAMPDYFLFSKLKHELDEAYFREHNCLSVYYSSDKLRNYERGMRKNGRQGGKPTP